MAKDPEARPIHMAHKVAPDGNISALCFRKPKAIDMQKASWTLAPEAVTCPKCRKKQKKT